MMIAPRTVALAALFTVLALAATRPAAALHDPGEFDDAHAYLTLVSTEQNADGCPFTRPTYKDGTTDPLCGEAFDVWFHANTTLEVDGTYSREMGILQAGGPYSKEGCLDARGKGFGDGTMELRSADAVNNFMPNIVMNVWNETAGQVSLTGDANGFACISIYEVSAFEDDGLIEALTF